MMLSSIVLDALLVLILLLMIPLGFLRGGLREMCTAAGVLFGILLASEWAGRWGGWIAGKLDTDAGGTRFLVSVAILVLAAGLLGYGSSAAFSYRPGPGGRMYGAYIALFTGIIVAGYLINRVIELVYEGTAPDLIEKSFVARALSAGFGWVLLLCAGGVLGGTLFGMFVRERPDEAYPYGHMQQRPDPAPPPAARPAEPTPQPADAEAAPAEPLRIREVRHWEEPAGQAPPDQGYGSGWRQTWPDPRGQGPLPPWEQRPAPGSPPRRRPGDATRGRGESSQSPQDVLRDWLREDEPGGESQ